MLAFAKTASAPLRDIRPDLRERLRSTTAEMDHLRGIVGDLEKTVQILEQMLAAEEQRFNPQVPTKKGPPTEPLAEFLIENMAASGLKSKDEMRRMAEQAGYDVDGRSIHATLVNLIKSGRAVEIGPGQFGARTQS
jgi:hypothetical protein